jgi:hypothetical protein
MRDKLLEIEKERKEKQRKLKESILIGEEGEQQGTDGHSTVPPSFPNSKKKSSFLLVEAIPLQQQAQNTAVIHNAPKIELKIAHRSLQLESVYSFCFSPSSHK